MWGGVILGGLGVESRKTHRCVQIHDCPSCVFIGFDDKLEMSVFHMLFPLYGGQWEFEKMLQNSSNKFFPPVPNVSLSDSLETLMYLLVRDGFRVRDPAATCKLRNEPLCCKIQALYSSHYPTYQACVRP